MLSALQIFMITHTYAHTYVHANMCWYLLLSVYLKRLVVVDNASGCSLKYGDEKYYFSHHSNAVCSHTQINSFLTQDLSFVNVGQLTFVVGLQVKKDFIISRQRFCV
ncbi:unnamed protein product [Ceratitis capitata]|uniref:(Mediterranean fruit fly) hypothetical protein n=1 Tax=Ceratitis capitata TaxID=7213 RepID=A0A811V3H1_CERCA|nr:unnamed protein product [Ceratitis capitata]